MYAVIYSQWGARYFDESLCLVGGPTSLSLTILSELRLRKVVITVNSYGFESVWTKFQYGCAIDTPDVNATMNDNIAFFGMFIVLLFYLTFANYEYLFYVILAILGLLKSIFDLLERQFQ
jgi:hypothetical protein